MAGKAYDNPRPKAPAKAAEKGKPTGQKYEMKELAESKPVSPDQLPEASVVGDDMPKVPTIHVPVHPDHLKHAVPGGKVQVHIHGTVKGYRAPSGRHAPNHEIEIEPSHSHMSALQESEEAAKGEPTPAQKFGNIAAEDESD